MTANELKAAQATMGLRPHQMAAELGISERAYHYRTAGKLPVRAGEAKAVDTMLADYHERNKK